MLWVWGSNSLSFPNNLWCWVSFHVLICLLSLEKCLFKTLPIFYATCWGFLCGGCWIVVPVCSGYFLLIRYVCKCFLPFWEMPWQDFSACWVESRPEGGKDGRGSPLPRCCSVLDKLCLTLCGPRDYSPPGFYPWDFPNKNTGLGCHFLFQGIFLTQGSNLRPLPRLLCCRQILYHWATRTAKLPGFLNISELGTLASPFCGVLTLWALSLLPPSLTLPPGT